MTPEQRILLNPAVQDALEISTRVGTRDKVAKRKLDAIYWNAESYTQHLGNKENLKKVSEVNDFAASFTKISA